MREGDRNAGPLEADVATERFSNAAGETCCGKLGDMKKKKPAGECEIVNLANVRRILDAKKEIASRIAQPGSRIVHMGVDVNVDKAPDDYLERYILPFVTKEGGARMSLKEFRDACADLRRAGFQVIPTCSNVDECGRCKGCELKIGGS